MVESTAALKNRMEQLLSEQGYQVSIFSTPDDAIQQMETSVQDPYSAIISGYMMPKIKGDEVLKIARSISMDTQRILIADTNQVEPLINAVNTAAIHACLRLPLQEEDFLLQVRHCCDQFEYNLKQKNLKRVTRRQNKMLFKIAGNFKKKTQHYAVQTIHKNKEIRILESRIKASGGQIDPPNEHSLTDILSRKNIVVTQKNIGREFILIKDRIRQLLETAAGPHKIPVHPVSYQEAVTFSLIRHEHRDLVKKELWPLVYNALADLLSDRPSGHGWTTPEIELDDFLSLTLSDENTAAFIRVKTPDNENLTTVHVRQFLEKHQVIYGVKTDPEIEAWLLNARPKDDPFPIAEGKPPKPSKNAEIRYHFPTDFLHAGKLNPDGSIDFQNRGEIPHVEEGAFLAAKISPEDGTPGFTIHGEEIPVQEPEDLTFSAGPGTRISEDGVRVYATIAGQPHLDAMGNISVCPEYQIKGDLGFETGNVSFDGNVVVKGAVKQGFKVRCASLTAQEIQGAEIDISGDLNVSHGIVDTELVKVKGSVQAKFIHNSKINSFGNLIVQKEIIDSKIYLSGACINTNGSIINSEISAKMGIDAGTIGTATTKPSTLTAGVDENVRLLISQVDAGLHVNTTAMNELAKEIHTLEKEDQSLHGIISQYAYVQDRAQLELKDITQKMENLKTAGDMAAYQTMLQTAKAIQKKAVTAEKKINLGFERQDAIAREKAQKRLRINEFRELNLTLEDEKKRLREFATRQKPLPEIKVSRKIQSRTRIFTENASMTLNTSSSRCRLIEIVKSSNRIGGVHFYEIKITDY